jgi:hypothetical protein
VLYNGCGKNLFLYLNVLLGSPSMTQDHYLLIIPFVGRSGVKIPKFNATYRKKLQLPRMHKFLEARSSNSSSKSEKIS